MISPYIADLKKYYNSNVLLKKYIAVLKRYLSSLNRYYDERFISLEFYDECDACDVRVVGKILDFTATVFTFFSPLVFVFFVVLVVLSFFKGWSLFFIACVFAIGFVLFFLLFGLAGIMYIAFRSVIDEWIDSFFS